MGVSKVELHRLVEALPEKETPVVKRFLEFVLSKAEAEDQAWLEADLGELPPYDWGPEGPPEGKPVRYKPGVGLIVEGGKQ
ncbi:MAG: hypothetical protein IMW93_06325 [Thermoanaerobacteraceae bacterium]|nr:hypothetical protein [Thermoanaerobacteraceae bacterium]